MELNPYKSPTLPSPPTSPKKPSVGTRILRIGLIMLGVGVAGIVLVFVCSYFLVNAGVPEPPLWLVGIVLTTNVLLPMGICLSIIGALVWMLSNRKKP